ncbi:MAG: SDR family NAD(P)-dependent oxidoreductase [Chloroflexota bacterium]
MKKNILITGASRGIGLATAKALIKAGHMVIGTSRNPSQVSGLSFPLLTLDIQDDQSAFNCVEMAIARLGHIDVLINNVGYDLYAAAEEASVAETIEQMDVNYFGTVRMTSAILPHMRSNGKGQIINISSIGGYLGLPFNSAYAASKYAVEGYSESLRLELRQFNIDVSLIEPEAVATESLGTSLHSPKEPISAYAPQRKKMVSSLVEMGSNSPVKPETVARTVLKVISTPNPKLRYPVGNTARWLPVMKQMLPQQWFERMMLNQFM